MALSTAKTMATARAQVRPENSPQPAEAMITPSTSWYTGDFPFRMG